MFNRERDAAQNTNNAGAWDNLAAVEFAAENGTGGGINRQQRKIIAGLLTKDYDNAILEHDTEISADLEESFLDQLATGEISRDDEKDFLLRIGDPIHTEGVGRDGIYDSLMETPHEKWILAFMSGYDASNWQRVDSVDVAKFTHDYPTPIDFEEKAQYFLNGVKEQVPEDQYGVYEQAMDNFQRKVFGKRYEYWVQMQDLNERAMERTGIATEELNEADELHVISKEMKEALVDAAKIDGDTYLYGGREYQLTPEVLDKCNLGPKYEVRMEGAQICLSDTFKIDKGGRLGAIAYIPTQEGVKVRSYYKSNSQGVWRYLPDYVTDGNKMTWYGKGMNEESTMLPLKLQESLAHIQEQGPADTGNVSPSYLLGGTTYRYNSKEEYRDRVFGGRMKGDFYKEVSDSPAIDFGALRQNVKQSPEAITVNSLTSPDFTKQTASFETTSSLAGEMVMEGYQSNDGNFEWSFCRDKDGRAWVGGLEVVSPITSTGLRAQWASAGDIATPLYEYRGQAAGYGDEGDAVGNYQGMWKNYLSKMPLIQDYLRVKNMK